MSTHVHVQYMCTFACPACAFVDTCLSSLFALDQEPDEVINAQRCSGKALEKTSPGEIIGFAGDTVRDRVSSAHHIPQALAALPVPLHPISSLLIVSLPPSLL